MKSTSMRAICARVLLCGLLFFAGSVPAGAQTFPTSGWLPLTQSGIALTDPSGDESPAVPGIDIVGDKNDPAAFIASDASFLYFRLRLAGNPVSPINHHFTSYAWTCLLDIDADPTSYELLTALDGITVGGSVDLYQNTTTSKADSIDDLAEVAITSYAVATNAESLSAGTAVGGGADYFADWAVAWADLPGLSKLAPFRLVCGSSTAQARLTAGDVLDFGSGSASFSATAVDSVLCGDGGCTYDAVFHDGFEGP
jgi:hypothetical protein